MKTTGKSSDALWVSVSEFAYILLFVSIGGLAFVFFQLQQSRELLLSIQTRLENEIVKNERLIEDNEKLQAEVDFLNELLFEKQNAVVACWRRPEEVVPEIVATYVVEDDFRLRIEAPSFGLPSVIIGDNRFSERVIEQTTTMLNEEFSYANANNCYLRVAVENRTHNYGSYKRVVDALTSLGIVIAH